MRRFVVVAAVVAMTLAFSAESASARPIMRTSILNGDQITAWFKANHPGKACFANGKHVHGIARMFLQEGRREGVSGDVAFAQSILETSWFRLGSACASNNYGGLGATDDGGRLARFPYPRIGIRAQIQHLRRYADPAAKVKKLHKPLVDPRFRLVKPPGQAPTWGSLAGRWATAANYGKRVLAVFKEMRAFNGV
jgi:hypothetical protein